MTALISDIIDEQKESILSMSNLDRYVINNGIKIPVNNIFRNKYRDYIKTLCVEIEMTESQIEKYAYRPKRFSQDLYGNMELWHILLWVNDMISIKEFNKTKIKILDPKNLSMLYKIISKEEENYTDVPIIE